MRARVCVWVCSILSLPGSASGRVGPETAFIRRLDGALYLYGTRGTGARDGQAADGGVQVPEEGAAAPECQRS
eukprot:1722916-Rhodomonas_salina.1